MKGLQSKAQGDRINTKNGWLMCPNCGRGRVLKLNADTSVENLPVFCKVCKKEVTVNICLSLSQCRPSTSA